MADDPRSNRPHLHRSGRFGAVTAISALALVAACTEWPQPVVRVVEVCLSTNDEYSRVLEKISDIASRHELTYSDRSQSTAISYAALQKSDATFVYADPVVNVSYRGDAGDISVNTLLRRDRVLVIGFVQKQGQPDRHPAEQEVVDELSQHWKVVELGEGVGASGEQCD